MNLSKAKFIVLKGVSFVRKHSPEILAVCGVVGVVGGTYGMCKATLEAAPIADDMAEQIEEYENLPKEDKNVKNLASIYIRGGVHIVRVYAPAASLEILGITCLLCAYGIVKQRNVALAGAYKALNDIFEAYRHRVIEEYGEDADFKFMHGMERVIDDGTGVRMAITDEVGDGVSYSPYSRIFDEWNSNWKDDPTFNRFFLSQAQAWANNQLKARGHVFLNEIYDTLGFDRTSAGAIVGWVLDGPDSDNVIDFGIYNIRTKDDPSVDFINGKAPSVLLDFNVDGVIYDLI